MGLGLREWSRAQGKDGSAPLEVIGFDTNLDHQQHAKKIGAVDRAEWKLSNAVSNADIVVVATPVATMEEVMSDIAPLLKNGAVVTDVGSTKSDVLRWGNALLPQTVSFVGGHPMAGKAQSIEAAEAGLFQGATWCICPSVRAGEDAIRNILGIVAALGAETFFIDPQEHDAYVAGVSHLPFIVSAALMNAVASDSSWRDMKTLTASGFRDITRLAAGSADMHRDIVLTNSEAITRWIDAMIAQMEQLKLDIRAEERAERLTAYFTDARDARADWSTQSRDDGELLQETRDELSGSMSGQMSRLLLGGFANRRRPDRPRDARTSDAPHSSDNGRNRG
jgi:prephenate dehydrogenase